MDIGVNGIIGRQPGACDRILAAKLVTGDPGTVAPYTSRRELEDVRNVGGKKRMVRFIAYVVATIVATLALGTISDRLISFDRAETVLLFGVVLGVINATIKPVVQLLTLPITCLTFGLFAIVVNAALFWLGAYITPDLEVSWWGALIGSIFVSVGSGIIFTVLDE
jgi:putative membrane protein